MSITINIDRAKLFEALVKPYIPLSQMKFAITDGDPKNESIWYRDGWIFYELSVDDKYPALILGKAHADLPEQGIDGGAVLVYLHELAPYHLLFFENRKGQYWSYFGIEIDSDGQIVYVHPAEGKWVQLAPPGTLVNGDVIFAVTLIYMDGGTKKIRVLIDRVDFERKTTTRLVEYITTLTCPYHVVSVYAMEPKGVRCKWGVAYYATGPIWSPSDVVPYLIKAGLPDPREIHPWR